MATAHIIPTRLKSKIPHTLSYPIGAKTISEALIGVPQFDDLTLNFWFSNRPAPHQETATPYRVLQVQFSGPKRFFSMERSRSEKGCYYDPQWTIEVRAVPRSLRHLIQNKILAEALPLIRLWLMANPHSAQREGSHRLVFSFDESKGELTHDEQASIDWSTTRVGRPR